MNKPKEWTPECADVEKQVIALKPRVESTPWRHMKRTLRAAMPGSSSPSLMNTPIPAHLPPNGGCTLTEKVYGAIWRHQFHRPRGLAQHYRRFGLVWAVFSSNVGAKRTTLCAKRGPARPHLCTLLTHEHTDVIRRPSLIDLHQSACVIGNKARPSYSFISPCPSGVGSALRLARRTECRCAGL